MIHAKCETFEQTLIRVCWDEHLWSVITLWCFTAETGHEWFMFEADACETRAFDVIESIIYLRGWYLIRDEIPTLLVCLASYKQHVWTGHDGGRSWTRLLNVYISVCEIVMWYHLAVRLWVIETREWKGCRGRSRWTDVCCWCCWRMSIWSEKFTDWTLCEYTCCDRWCDFLCLSALWWVLWNP